MARPIKRLSDREVANKKKPGYYADGGGLWLQVSKSGTKSWIFRYTRQGKTHDLGLGSYLNVSLKTARDKAQEQREALGRGEDPMAQRWAAKAAAASKMTFSECAEKYIAVHRDGWKNPKHAQQWTNTLETYAAPIIGNLDVALVDTPHILRILEPIWTTKNETASRVRGRIERILAWATTRRLRHGDNPAAWKNHLDTLLPKPSAVQKKAHHAALPYRDASAFLGEVRQLAGIAPRALEFTILTAARTGETIGATWDEIDLDSKVWTVPAARMKAKREHRIPLSTRAVAILEEIKEQNKGAFVFPGWSGDKGLSNMAMLKVLKDMGRNDLTVHGFRSTFRDWCAEATQYPREIAEAALAHTLTNKAEAAYFRSDLFEKRREMMQDWCNYIGKPATA